MLKGYGCVLERGLASVAQTWLSVVHVLASYMLLLLLLSAAKSRQLCPTLCDPIDGSPPGSAVTRILQARTLEWVVISFSNASK